MFHFVKLLTEVQLQIKHKEGIENKLGVDLWPGGEDACLGDHAPSWITCCQS